MSDGGDQLAHCCQPCDPNKFRLYGSQRLLGAPAPGDVHDRPDEFESSGLGVFGLANTLHVLDRSVGQNDSVFMFKSASLAHG
ncbi:MAG TPA: hypothetical protein VHX39_28680, partial [Acetobacteraceae bacterium]|nr:hypothetical protein [Acetobacteraceae bacterium]